MSVEINISNSEIMGSQIGEKNIMNLSGGVLDDDWKCLEQFWGDRAASCNKESVYYFLINEARDYTKKKDRKGLKEFIKKYASEFATGIFCNLASTSVINALANLGIKI